MLGLDPAADAAELRSRVGVMLQSGGVPTTARAAEYLRVMAGFYANPLDPAMLLSALGPGRLGPDRVQAAVRRAAAAARRWPPP